MRHKICMRFYNQQVELHDLITFGLQLYHKWWSICHLSLFKESDGKEEQREMVQFWCYQQKFICKS